jgi:adhesin transport system membrane fusion protein
VRVQAEGKVIPSSQLQVVQSFDGGIVREIFVKDGDKVKKGQVLMRLDQTQFASSYGENLVKEASLRARIARLRAIVENKLLNLKLPSDPRLAEIYQNEIDLYKRQLDQLKTQENIQRTKIRQAQLELKSAQDQRAQLQESYNLIQKEIRITQPLVKRGYASEVDLLKLKREANDIRSKLKDVQNTIPKLQSSIREARAELKKIQQEFRNKAHQELNDAESELAALQETQKALRERVQRTDLLSPVNGIVKRVLVTTIGGVVKPGDPVVEIVPEDDVLIVEARVRPQDIGFLRPGLPAKVKFSAYDFAIYGGLEGKVVNISADTITDEKGDSYYLVRIKTDKNYLGTPEHPLALLPGMTATVDIITGKRTILQYLLNPIVKVKENALRE